MSLVSTRSAAPTQILHTVAEAVGLSCLAAALLLNALPAVGLAEVGALPFKAGLLVFATGQILAGLAAWRRHEPLAALVLAAFGLFWFSRSAYAVAAPAEGTATSAVLLLFLWGGYALILACEAEAGQRLLRLTLGAIGAALLVQAFGVACAAPALLVLAGVVSLLAALATAVTAIDRARQCHRDLLR